MNIERAIEILDPRHRETYESIDPINEACLMGMQALKKQVPAKPKITLHGTTGYNTKCSCPVCGSMVNSDNYCRNCGQAIDRNKEAATNSVNKHITGADTCVMCGEIIPEGTQVCPLCKQTVGQHKTNYNRIKAMSVEEKLAYNKLSEMTVEQKLELYNKYNDYKLCGICSITGCNGLTLGPNGPIYPRCADGNFNDYVSLEKLDDECLQIILDELE